VGFSMQRYHLFGKLLSELEGLEASSLPHRVQISGACKVAFQQQMAEDKLGDIPFAFETREVDALKTSKGEVVEWQSVGGYPTFMLIDI